MVVINHDFYNYFLINHKKFRQSSIHGHFISLQAVCTVVLRLACKCVFRVVVCTVNEDRIGRGVGYDVVSNRVIVRIVHPHRVFVVPDYAVFDFALSSGSEINARNSWPRT
jgi:hypothetical protein